jgi:DNA polymerase IV
MTQLVGETPPEFPPIYLLKFNIDSYDLLALEREIGDALVTSISEAKVVIGNITQKKRALLEFRIRKVHTEEVVDEKLLLQDEAKDSQRAKKKRKIEKKKQGKEVITIDSSTESEDEPSRTLSLKRRRKTLSPLASSSPVAARSLTPDGSSTASDLSQDDTSKEDLFGGDTIKVCNWAWYHDSVKAGVLLPTAKYLIYEGRIIEQPKYMAPPPPTKLPAGKAIIERARADTPPRSQPSYFKKKHRRSGSPASQTKSQPPHLVHETTSDHEYAKTLPPLPPYLAPGTYSCQRATPLTGPNDAFIAQLRKIQLHRQLVRDDKGVSAAAYTRAITSIAAYPHTITVPQEIRRLPYCGDKYVSLYEEWRDTGVIREVEELEANPYLNTLKIFYDVFDVGEKTARQWYARGWRDLEDVQIHSWDDLPRTVQVGLKYYTDFQAKIPRPEVESIAAVILAHANALRPGYQMLIVGGYRRGKPQSSDVDVILTHRDEAATLDFVLDVVEALYKAQYVAQTLRIFNATSNRGQATVSWKGGLAKTGAGFCTLDKAFLAWQDPAKLADGSNVMRRVDIIIAPWKVAGCAVVGWTGGKQFEKDLRLFSRSKGVKFDSSGLRAVEDGKMVDYEGGEETLLGKEKSIFRGLGLEWREPTERCTG